MTDILNQIDDVLADLSCCAFCKTALVDRGPSGDFCGEMCQWNWNERRVRVKSGIEEEAVAPVADRIRRALPERDYPLYDNCPARGDWPGGPRYGYRRERTLNERHWTDEERRRAARLHIDLPDVDWLTVEMWWDMPRQHTVEVVSRPVVWTATADPAPVEDVTFEQRVRTAKRYGKRTWETDPFARPAQPEPPAFEVIHEAFRQEVIRQGLTTYDIDGVTYHVDQPVIPSGVMTDEQFDQFLRDQPDSCFDTAPVTYGIDPTSDGSACIVIARVDVDGRVHVAPHAPPVDAAVEPDPTRWLTAALTSAGRVFEQLGAAVTAFMAALAPVLDERGAKDGRLSRMRSAYRKRSR